MKKKAIVCGMISVLVAAVMVLLIGWGDAIFQCGNPLPYLMAAVQLDDETPYALVKETENFEIYITARDVQEKMIAAIEAATESEFLEQGGRAFFFENAQEHFAVENEIYWGRFLVWRVPEDVLQG